MAPAPYSQAFLATLNQLFLDEGYHDDDPLDPGGDTYYGISRADNLDMPWPPTREQAIERYWIKYWQPYDFDKLPGLIGGKVFNVGVDTGVASAIICLQRACRAVGKPLPETGRVDPQTSQAVMSIASIRGDALLCALRSELGAHYRLVAAAKPELGHEDLKGWLNRAYS